MLLSNAPMSTTLSKNTFLDNGGNVKIYTRNKNILVETHMNQFKPGAS